MWKGLGVSNPPKRWRVGLVTLIVFAPFCIWSFLGLFYDKLPPPRQAIAVFWIYLFGSYFVMKAILRKPASNKQ